MKKVIISAYAISPTRGSEYGVGWNFVTMLSKYYNITVLYGTSGDKLGDTEELEDYLLANKIDGVEFIKVNSNRLISFFDNLNHLGFNLSFYIAYRLWQREVFKVAKMVVAKHDILLLHQLNTIGFSSPGFLWKIEKPIVWGPIGGTFPTPKVLMKNLNFKEKFRYLLRNWNISYSLKNSRFLKKVVNRVDGGFVATIEEQKNFVRYFDKKFTVIPENNIHILENMVENLEIGKVIKLIWIGRLDGGKALDILLDALEILIKKTNNWKLEVLGDGPLSKSLRERVAKSVINDKVTWHGQKQRAETIQALKNSDLHILTSIKDSNPTVLLESIENGIPTIALDHSGMSTMIKEGEGVKIKIREIYLIAEDIAENLLILIQNPEKIIMMKLNILNSKQHPTWSNAIKETLRVYDSAIKNYEGKD